MGSGKTPGLVACGAPWHNVAGPGGKQNPVRWQTGRQSVAGVGWEALNKEVRMWGKGG